ncbi:MAG: class I SAM-dependent methyltransferase [Bacteroidaceae bacterium]|nr:class I SAM-dependent methyltransferase [Bacteroidaceae bacterium]MBR5149168.1 class I SAM-dependent methyltransferase [Bacteroidaceae bacterium]
MSRDEAIEAYILQHMDEESDYLKALYRQTHVKLINPRMTSGHLQGRLLKMLVQMVRPQRVLEIGTFTGYSALCMAEGLEEGAMLHTYEIDDELEDFTRPWIEGSPHGHKVCFHIGNALDEVPHLGETFDLVFMDGDKRQYMQYYEMVMQHTSPNAIILADNTLWDGHVVDKAYLGDRQTAAINEFNAYLAADQRVEKFILPLRDGLTMIRKKF